VLAIVSSRRVAGFILTGRLADYKAFFEACVFAFATARSSDSKSFDASVTRRAFFSSSG
jgi:hypothetical protein